MNFYLCASKSLNEALDEIVGLNLCLSWSTSFNYLMARPSNNFVKALSCTKSKLIWGCQNQIIWYFTLKTEINHQAKISLFDFENRNNFHWWVSIYLTLERGSPFNYLMARHLVKTAVKVYFTLETQIIWQTTWKLK